MMQQRWIHTVDAPGDLGRLSGVIRRLFGVGNGDEIDFAMQGQDAVIDGRDCDSVVDGDCGGDGPILERSN